MCRARGGRLRLGEAEVGEGLFWAQAPQPPTKVQLESLELVASAQQSGRGKPINPEREEEPGEIQEGPSMEEACSWASVGGLDGGLSTWAGEWAFEVKSPVPPYP